MLALTELHELLKSQGEHNWIRGINGALEFISLGDIESARSIYRSMTHGGRGFSEYNVWDDDDQVRLDENRRLDELRRELSSIFELTNLSTPAVIGST